MDINFRKKINLDRICPRKLIARYRSLEATVDQIHATMDGKEWSSNTLNEIAEILKTHGYHIRSPDEVAKGV